MQPILLLMKPQANRRLLAEWLAADYRVIVGEDAPDLGVPFDLGIVDGPTLERSQEAIQARRAAERPVWLPFLLLVSRSSQRMSLSLFRNSVDDMVVMPVTKAELRARVRALLRARALSRQLKLRNDDLEAFVRAVAHDLRAPARTAAGFAGALLEEHAEGLDAQARHYLSRIQMASRQMRTLLDTLLDYLRLGQTGVNLKPVALGPLLVRCLAELEPALSASGGEICLKDPWPTVRADPILLQGALTNLLHNGIKFVAPDVTPRVVVSAELADEVVRISVQDNGIGIAPQDQPRIFEPFERLHGEETYPGTGLGLSTVRKSVKLMGGDIGLSSTPGVGSVFWIELSSSMNREFEGVRAERDSL